MSQNVKLPNVTRCSKHTLSDTDNIVNDQNGGYEHVAEFIPIGKPDAGTLAKLSTLEPSETSGDRTLPSQMTRINLTNIIILSHRRSDCGY